jgi:hypothetical protein
VAEFVPVDIPSKEIRLKIPRLRRGVVGIGLFECRFEFVEHPTK